MTSEVMFGLLAVLLWKWLHVDLWMLVSLNIACVSVEVMHMFMHLRLLKVQQLCFKSNSLHRYWKKH